MKKTRAEYFAELTEDIIYTQKIAEKRASYIKTVYNLDIIKSMSETADNLETATPDELDNIACELEEMLDYISSLRDAIIDYSDAKKTYNEDSDMTNEELGLEE